MREITIQVPDIVDEVMDTLVRDGGAAREALYALAIEEFAMGRLAAATEKTRFLDKAVNK